MEKVNPYKVYVAVHACFDSLGRLLPDEITWIDGTKFQVDRVLDIRQASAMRAGGQGDRYTIQVNGKQSFLFFERSTNLTGNVIGRWFVERKSI